MLIELSCRPPRLLLQIALVRSLISLPFPPPKSNQIKSNQIKLNQRNSTRLHVPMNTTFKRMESFQSVLVTSNFQNKSINIPLVCVFVHCMSNPGDQNKKSTVCLFIRNAFPLQKKSIGQKSSSLDSCGSKETY